MPFSPRSLICFLPLLLLSEMACAASHALLVGISDYQRPIPALEGPRNDVTALKASLIEYWDVPPASIITLLDTQATKSAILRAINDLEQRSQPGDDVFIYLSGHGTSALDRANKLPLPTTSGAFIPYDMGRPTSTAEFTQRLLVGRTDLQPVLRRLDRGGRRVLVLIDACYSGNTVRAGFADEPLPKRFVDVRDILPSRAFGDDLGGAGSSFGSNTKVEEPYPYKEVFYLGASGEHEMAEDIPTRLLSRVPTLDGKPHGAFSDTVLRIMQGRINADADSNGYISYGELYQAARSHMATRRYSHTPSRLPSLADDERGLSSRPVFSRAAPPAWQPTPGTFTVNAASAPVLAAQLQRQGLVLVSQDATVTVRRDGYQWLLVASSGDVITRVQDSDLLSTVLSQRQLHQWLQASHANDFGIYADMQGQGVGSTRTAGEVLGFYVRAEANAYVVLVNVGATGNMSLLYPYDAREKVRFSPGQKMALPNLVRVAAPFGRETVFAYAFEQWPVKLDAYMGSSVHLNSPRGQSLRQILDQAPGGSARVALSLYTAP